MNRFACFILLIAALIAIPGCFKEIVETRDPLPVLIWPEPPEVPRIRFVNSISAPEHLNIKESFSDRLMNFIKGKEVISLVNPYGVITDSESRLYAVDTFSKQVHVYDPGNNNYHLFPEESPGLISPIDIAIDRNDTIYVSDSKEGVVYIFKDLGKQFVKAIGRGSLIRPTGLAFNHKTDELLVLDTKKSEIVRYDIDDHNIIGTWGKEGDARGFLNNPTNVFVSQDGMIYVTDSLNFRIQIFSHDGKFIREFGAVGDSPGYFARPRGVAVDSEGHIYVVDALFDNVQIFNERGELLMDFGRPGSGYGEFWLPSGIFIDSDDNIYVSDSYNNRIQVFQYIKHGEFSN